MLRRELADARWDRIKDLVPGKETDRGSTGRDNRLFVDAVLWIARTSSPWRDLPDAFGGPLPTFIGSCDSRGVNRKPGIFAPHQ